MKTIRLVLSTLYIVLSFMMLITTAYAAQENIADAEKSFLEGNYESTVLQAQRLIDARSSRRDEIYYLKGLSELKLNRFNDARESFNYIASKYPNSRKIFDARLGIGDSYMLAGDLNSAAGIYQGMLDDFRSNDNLPMVHSRLASCRKGLGSSDKAVAVQARAAAPVKVNAAPKTVAPASNISPRDSEDIDLVMATGRMISVQVGSFKNRRNAEKLAQKLAASGYESRIEIPVELHDKLYRVKVGRVSSMSEAEALRSRLKAAGYTTKICDGETL